MIRSIIDIERKIPKCLNVRVIVYISEITITPIHWVANCLPAVPF